MSLPLLVRGLPGGWRRLAGQLLVARERDVELVEVEAVARAHALAVVRHHVGGRAFRTRPRRACRTRYSRSATAPDPPDASRACGEAESVCIVESGMWKPRLRD